MSLGSQAQQMSTLRCVFAPLPCTRNPIGAFSPQGKGSRGFCRLPACCDSRIGQVSIYQYLSVPTGIVSPPFLLLGAISSFPSLLFVPSCFFHLLPRHWTASLPTIYPSLSSSLSLSLSLSHCVYLSSKNERCAFIELFSLLKSMCLRTMHCKHPNQATRDQW